MIDKLRNKMINEDLTNKEKLLTKMQIVAEYQDLIIDQVNNNKISIFQTIDDLQADISGLIYFLNIVKKELENEIKKK